ncbi:methylenetetrahydrofolate reductase C-terminal domain-containing protein [Candidatus Dependentiae bacterium]|nr:methylenetetrahydrofolate reductase C-terminal domain-containing protein [Candidatus Dependentiae bacterium]
MIITEQKPIEEILKYLNPEEKLYIIGCAQCATSCGTGGEKQVEELVEFFSKKGYEITGQIVLDPPCDERISKIELKKNIQQINNCTAIIVLSCGAGISVIADVLPSKKIIAGLNGVFLGSLKRLGIYNEYCSLCGSCILSKTGGICPVTRCAKGLLNGPCGGVISGKYCEVNPDNDCAWAAIIRRLNELNQTGNLNEHIKPKDFAKYPKPNKFNKKVNS